MKIDYLKFKRSSEKTGKTYFSLYDLKKFYPFARESLKVLLSHWKKKKYIYHLARGFYTFNITNVDYLRMANELDQTSYISFEYALYYHNLIDQVPQIITLATPKRHRIIKAGYWTFEYTHLKKSLFFGYELKNKVYIATVEKAMADTLYLIARGKRIVELDTLEKKKINKRNLNKVLNRFPHYVRRMAYKIDII